LVRLYAERLSHGPEDLGIAQRLSLIEEASSDGEALDFLGRNGPLRQSVT
jgi:hypothetical protein